MKRTLGTQPLLTKPISTVLWVVILTLFGFLAVSSLLLQKQLREDTDLRGQASVTNGVVHITSPTTTLKLGTESPIQIDINTNNTQVSAVQLTLDLTVTGENQQFGSGFSYRVTNPKLRLADWNGKATTNGYQYQFMLLPNVVGDPFSTSGNESLMALSLIPASTNAYRLDFDQSKTIVTRYQTANQDVLNTVENVVLNVIQDVCSYSFGAWSSCQNGKQIRTYTANPSTCAAPDATQLEQSCLQQCAYTYSDWGACTNGWKTRTVATTPANCTWYQTEAMQELTQACETVGYDPDFSLYTYEACWYDRTIGNSTYVLWNKNRYPNVTAIDVSIYSDFRDFANKEVSGGTSTLGDSYLVTDSTNFRTYSDGKKTLYSFYPEVNYYFRLWNGKHSSVVRFFIPKCAGVGGVSYKQCNESCSSNTECAPNLTCSNNQCRRAGNVDSTSCVLAPDKGLNRSCNEYCADSRECTAGLSCYWNRCRNPKNQPDTSCKAPAKKSVYRVIESYSNEKGGSELTTEAAEMQCNETCAGNSDCALGLRCYSNRCRLPANLASFICSATEIGEDPELAIGSTTSGVIDSKPSVSPAATTSTTKKVDSTGGTDNKTTQKPAWITSLFTKLPFILGGLLLIVVALLVLPMLFGDSRRKDARYINPNTAQKTSDLESEQRRLEHLKQNLNMQTPKNESANSMMERLKQRGVQPPGI